MLTYRMSRTSQQTWTLQMAKLSYRLRKISASLGYYYALLSPSEQTTRKKAQSPYAIAKFQYILFRQECLRTCAHGSGGSSESANVCRLPIQPGDTCRGRLRRYGFNTAAGRCESFFYSGCDGNDNNFETLAACRERCSGSVTFPDGG